MSKVAKVYSASTLGLDSYPVEIEVDIGAGLPSFTIVGLPDKAIDESKERIRSAIKNSGFSFPQHRLTINLAPADVKKEGPSFDLPMALGILLAGGQLDDNIDIRDSLFIGELSLDGKIRHVNGILPIAIFAEKGGFKKIFLPRANIKEASLVKNIEIYPVDSLFSLVKHLIGESLICPSDNIINHQGKRQDLSENDFRNIAGQEQAKRALEIAASGNHNVLFFGPPGSGKTLLAKSLPTILPAMTEEEILEVTKIYSVSGLLDEDNGLVVDRPFRSPHHTTSNVAVVGGGTWPSPGEISLAHHGVLFLDEFPEFPRSVIESLRQPLEDGVVTISRAAGSLKFPAQFILVAAQNPCPCGYFGDTKNSCICSPTQIMKYFKRISGPILDRIDLHVEVPKVNYKKLKDCGNSEKSSQIKKRVEKAREVQRKRFSKNKINSNAEMNSRDIKKYCQLDSRGENLLAQAVEAMNLSARAYHRILKLARTIADLDGKDNIESYHIAEALQYRPKERRLF